MTAVRYRLMLLVSLWLAAMAAVADFSIRHGTIQLEDGVFRAEATIDFDLSEEALEALDNGVPLTFVVEAEVRREDAWWWERALVSHELRYELRFHPLAGLYAVIDLDTGIQERFATREAAMEKLGELHSLEIIPSSRLADGVDYTLSLRAYLDIESLPLPLRPLAYISPGWYLSTGWSRWRLHR